MRIALISLTTMSLLASSVNAGEFKPTTIKISLREHKTNERWNPNWSWSKPSSSMVRMTSTRSGLGNGYMFFVMNREFIHGRYLRITWQADTTWSKWNHRVEIMDGAYIRSNDSDFPFQGRPLEKGNGILQTGLIRLGSFSMVTEEFLVDVSGGSQEYVTVFIRSRDAWVEQSGWLEVDLLEINWGAGGSGTMWRALFNEDVHMEKTGSTGDYGYIKTLQVPPDFVVPEYPLGTISAIAAGLISILLVKKRQRISLH
jgi:hypothetical protein